MDTTSTLLGGRIEDLIHMKAKTLNLGLVKVTYRSRQKRAFGASPKLTPKKNGRAEHDESKIPDSIILRITAGTDVECKVSVLAAQK